MDKKTGVHQNHCYQGKYADSCKYGDNDCPAKPKEKMYKTNSTMSESEKKLVEILNHLIEGTGGDVSDDEARIVEYAVLYHQEKTKSINTVGMTNDQIEARINEILSDERMSYNTANIFSNAPLALIQHGMTVELHTLQRVLGVKLTNIKELRKEK